MKIGILAYGSLIDEPGEDIGMLIIDRIPCTTPFRVEFARLSKTRDGAPTLVPVEVGGGYVSAMILVLNSEVTSEEVKSMLYRRETRSTDRTKKYEEPKKPGLNSVIVKTIREFHGVKEVIYTSIGSNISDLDPNILADYAIESILNQAGEQKKDGVRYLLNAKNNGILTALSQEYEAEILNRTSTTSLGDAIDKLDQMRSK